MFLVVLRMNLNMYPRLGLELRSLCLSVQDFRLPDIVVSGHLLLLFIF